MGDGPNSHRQARKAEQGWSQNLNDVTENWTTPQAHDVRQRGAGQTNGKTKNKMGNACLATDAVLWGTPRASDAEMGGPNQSFGSGGTPLPAQAAQWPTPMSLHPGTGSYNPAGNSDFTRKAEALSMGIVGNWPTPASRDHKGENSPDHLASGTGRLHMDQLPNAVAHGFSLPVLPMPPHGPKLSQLRPIWRPLRALLIASHGRHVWRRLWKRRGKRRLNPLFVGWLMGWPIGHALCACSATEFTHWQQHMRGALSQLPMASGPWIWMPGDAAQPPAQMNLFEGLDP
jgi:hypothetical protein